MYRYLIQLVTFQQFLRMGYSHQHVQLSSLRANLSFAMDLTHFRKHTFNNSFYTRNYQILFEKCLNTEFFLVHIWKLFTQ